MKLRNRYSFVTHGRDRSAPERVAPRITHVLYILVLLGLISYGIVYAVNHWFRFEARGQVVTDTTLLSANSAGELREIGIDEGDEIMPGSILGRIVPPKTCGSNQAEIESLRIDIAVNEEEISGMQKRIDRARERLEEMALRESLELDRHGQDTAERRLRDEIADLQVDKERLRKKTTLFREKLAAYRSGELREPKCSETLVVAPFRSEVVTVHRTSHESVAGGDPIVTLRAAEAGARVIAYLPPEQLDDIEHGQEVTVAFPDGSSDIGVVDRIGSSGEEVATTLRNGYRRELTDIRFQVRPAANGSANQWTQFHLMEVEVQGVR